MCIRDRVCHYCGYEQPAVKLCPSCGSKYILGFRAGTEAMEEQLHKMFPQARVPVSYTHLCEMRCPECDGKYPCEISLSETHKVSCYRYYDKKEGK